MTFAPNEALAGWSLASTPNVISTTDNRLDNVTCLSATDCWAVGSYAVGSNRFQALIERWDGTTWTVVPSPNTSPTRSNQLFGVACTSSTDCWAVGISSDGTPAQTLIMRWNGSVWSVVTSPNKGTRGNILREVTCTSSTDCWAVGFYIDDSAVSSGGFSTLIERWDGNSWSIVESPNYRDNDNPAAVTVLSVLNSVTCTSASDCWAVGWGKSFLLSIQSLTLHWDGATWSFVPSPSAGPPGSARNAELSSVTCVSAADCWAVGINYEAEPEFSRTLVLRWNGSAWSAVPSPNLSRGNLLNGVSCTSTSDCWAVGYHATNRPARTLTEHWDGTSWTIVPSADVSGKQLNILSSVSCLSGVDCWAVGYSAEPGPSQTLAERHTGAVTTGSTQLLNISTRAQVQQGDNVLIGGFIIGGTDQKRVLLRAIGPSLGDNGVQGALQNPTLELFRGTSSIASNDNWKDSQRPEIEETGIPPSHDAESAIVRTLGPGNYTAVVRGVNNDSGVALVEAYDVNQAAASRLLNISTRAVVQTQQNALIGGVIVGGSAGSTGQVLIRAIGPSLVAAGITNALQDPTLELLDGNGSSIAANDDWRQTQQSEIAATGLQPSDNRESAILRSLSPGNYTAIVRGKSESSGVGLVEVYKLE
ncbi:MAG TPA: hypothetical protein VK993_12355 [Chthoniobacterales bacterium]|nr:hypothetical protein [Chthoniobacterales bacterium]